MITSECTVEKLHEWYCNKDLRNMSAQFTRFVMKDRRRGRVRWRTRQDDVAEPSVSAMNESEWSGGGHSCPIESDKWDGRKRM